MSFSIEDLDAMPEKDAAEIFRSCCGSSRWVDGMTGSRPFKSVESLSHAADEEWNRCTRDDWLEAFSHHPRIGDRDARGAAADEQAAARNSPLDVRDEIQRMNRAYEEKFGHIYIVCATGRSAEAMLRIAQSRMQNDPETELRVAAEEQRKIMHIRLSKILGEEK